MNDESRLHIFLLVYLFSRLYQDVDEIVLTSLLDSYSTFIFSITQTDDLNKIKNGFLKSLDVFLESVLDVGTVDRPLANVR